VAKLASYKETEVGPLVLRKIAKAIDECEQHRMLTKTRAAGNLRKDISMNSKFESTIDDLIYKKELWKLDEESTKDLIQGFKDKNIARLRDNLNLSAEQKK